MFRVSLGSASCTGFSSSNTSLLEVCKTVQRKILYLKSLRKSQLERWSDVETSEIDVGGKKALFTIFKTQVNETKDIVIVQAFYPTWKSLNYLSFGRVGRIFAEGFYIDSENVITDAAEEDLWAYR